MKSYVLTLLVFVLGITAVSPAHAQSFQDVPQTSRFYSSIASLVYSGAVDAQNKYFHLFRPVNRAEAVKMVLVATERVHEDNLPRVSRSSFIDVATHDWYLPYAHVAHHDGILGGYPDGSFQGDKTIILSEALKVLFHAYDIPVKKYFVSDDVIFNYDPDAWDAPYVSSALKYGILADHEYLRRDRQISRAFFAEMVYRFKQYSEGHTSYLDGLNKEFAISIPRLNVHRTPLMTTDPFDEGYYQWVLTKGIGHALKYPGENGKVFLYGHSSGYSWDDSPYKQVFRALNQLEDGDEIVVHYLGVDYTYLVSGREIRDPDDVSVLQDSTHEQLAILTCWPPDSVEQRYLIYAERQ